jgi:hypothetical protein
LSSLSATRTNATERSDGEECGCRRESATSENQRPPRGGAEPRVEVWLSQGTPAGCGIPAPNPRATGCGCPQDWEPAAPSSERKGPWFRRCFIPASTTHRPKVAGSDPCRP